MYCKAVFHICVSASRSSAGLLAISPPSMYLLSTLEKNVGAALLQRNAFQNFTSAIQFSYHHQRNSFSPIHTRWRKESELFILFFAHWQYVIAEEFQFHGKHIASYRGNHQSRTRRQRSVRRRNTHRGQRTSPKVNSAPNSLWMKVSTASVLYTRLQDSKIASLNRK